jgi:hypothetical protein
MGNMRSPLLRVGFQKNPSVSSLEFISRCFGDGEA